MRQINCHPSSLTERGVRFGSYTDPCKSLPRHKGDQDQSGSRPGREKNGNAARWLLRPRPPAAEKEGHEILIKLLLCYPGGGPLFSAAAGRHSLRGRQLVRHPLSKQPAEKEGRKGGRKEGRKEKQRSRKWVNQQIRLMEGMNGRLGTRRRQAQN